VTFCVGVRVAEGLVGLADTQIVKGGGELSSKAKLSLHDHHGHPFFVMTSGLRSIRDKVVLQLEDDLAVGPPAARLHHVATAFGQRLQAVRDSDGPWLQESGLHFNLHALVGGQLADDGQPELFLIYPEGNWVVATEDAPSFIIGRTSYGKPILDRLLTPTTPLPRAVLLAYLAFDATRASVVDVEFPIDVVVMGGNELRHRRFERDDLQAAHDQWHAQLRDAVMTLPTDWAAELLPEEDR
jgi:putative proteasome-type protease